MLIKSYGQFWNPDIVDWGGGGAGNGLLTGRIKRKKVWHEIDFWGAKGIYVLHSDFKSIYVGKAFGTSIGRRLRDHLSDRLAGRWDMFSWYSVSSPRITTKDVSQPGQRQLKPETITDTLEALAILVADPALNRRRETLKGAYEALQPDSAQPRTVRNYLQEIIGKLDKAL
jgi:hypothetical protein